MKFLPGGCSIGESGGAGFLSLFRSALRLARDTAFIFRNDLAEKRKRLVPFRRCEGDEPLSDSARGLWRPESMITTTHVLPQEHPTTPTKVSEWRGQGLQIRPPKMKKVGRVTSPDLLSSAPGHVGGPKA